MIHPKNMINPIDKLQDYKLHEQAVLLCTRKDFCEEIKSYIIELFETPGFNWYEFLGISMINRVNGVVYKNIKDIDRVPKYVKYFLKIAYLEQKERTSIHKNEIIKVSKMFEENNIKHAFLKGAVLNTIIYSPGDRISNDTDILVSVDDLDKAVSLLKDDNYVQGEVLDDKSYPATKKEILFARLNTYEIVPLHKPVDERYLPYHEVDINFRLGNDSTQEEAVELLNNTVSLEEKGYSVRTLSLEEFLIFLCIHHYREAIMVYKIVRGDDLNLYKFMDIHFLLSSRGNEIDWKRFADRTKEMNRKKDVYYTLCFTEKLYPGTVSADILDDLKPDDISFLNEYRGRDNSDEVYTWKTDFIHRVFSYERQLEAMDNIGEESARFRNIIDIVKGQNQQ